MWPLSCIMLYNFWPSREFMAPHAALEASLAGKVDDSSSFLQEAVASSSPTVHLDYQYMAMESPARLKWKSTGTNRQALVASQLLSKAIFCWLDGCSS